MITLLTLQWLFSKTLLPTMHLQQKSFSEYTYSVQNFPGCNTDHTVRSLSAGFFNEK